MLHCRSNNSLTDGTVLPSFAGGSGVRPKPGIGIVHVNVSQVSENVVLRERQRIDASGKGRSGEGEGLRERRGCRPAVPLISKLLNV